MENLNMITKTLKLEDPIHFQCGLFLYVTFVILNNKTQSSNAFHAILYTLVSGFGGGILVPILLADNNYFPFPMCNDAVVPITAIAWVLCQNKTVAAAFNSPVGTMIKATGFELVRAKLLTTWIVRGLASIPPSTFSKPVFG